MKRGPTWTPENEREKVKKEYTWKDAKRKCRLTGTEVRMAVELGSHPGSLIHNIPHKNEQWKDVPALRIRRFHEERFGTEVKEETDDPYWKKVKKKYRLNDSEVSMGVKLRLNPRYLKDSREHPAALYIRRRYEKVFLRKEEHNLSDLKEGGNIS